VVAAAALAAVALAAAPAAAQRPSPQFLIAVFGPSRPPATAREVATLAPGLKAYAIQAPAGAAAGVFAQRLRRTPGVVAVQPNEPVRSAQAQAPGFCATIAPSEISSVVPATVDALGVSAPTTKPIAILDTGVDPQVPELAGRVVSPFNALDGGSDASDADGHGTQVAAIAAGSPGHFRGVSPTSPVMPIKIFQANGEGTAASLVKGIETAVARGAGVINVSGSAPAADASAADTRVVAMAIDGAYAKGVIVVIAAGNDGASAPYVPGNLPHTLTVGSGDPLGGRSGFSNTGPWLDLLAPADNLLPPMPAALCSTGYGPATGTSFAAPAVAGGVALVRQLRPTLTTQQLFDVMRSSAKDTSVPGRDDDSGYGVLDVAGAVKAPLPKADPGELDDDVFWLKGAFASQHKTLLAKAKIARVKARVSSAKDPQDVYKVFVAKGQVLDARVTGTAGALLDVTIWDRSTGSFDISNGVAKKQLVSTGGYSDAPQVAFRAKRGGTYYVSVDTPDVPDPAQDDNTVTRADEPYQLTVTRKTARAGGGKRHTRRTTR
jgi:subtilisin family serine protease